jgi:hypothetical protein
MEEGWKREEGELGMLQTQNSLKMGKSWNVALYKWKERYRLENVCISRGQ